LRVDARGKSEVQGMDHLQIRKVGVSELDRIVELQLALQRHSEACSASIWRYTAERTQLLRQEYETYVGDENRLLLVAVFNGTIVGFLSSMVSQRTDQLPPIIGTIGSLFIQDAFRRRGIGSRLVRDACQFFKSKRVEDVYVRFVVGNREGEGFWKKLGFTPILVTAGTNLTTVEDRLHGGS